MDSPVAVITGAAQRVGRGITIGLHKRGYRVLLHYRSSVTAAGNLMEELNAVRVGSALTYQCDLRYDSDLASRCCEIFDFCYRSFGRCDVLVNNASSYLPFSLFPDGVEHDGVSSDAFGLHIADIFGSNAIAPLFLIRAFARLQSDPTVNKNRNLSVVNLCDAMIDQPEVGFTAYTMAKHALCGLTKSAAVELAPLSIRVNAVSPGLSTFPIAMPQEQREKWRRRAPLGHQEASPSQIADVVAFLVSESAAYITGAIINVDGGLSLNRM